MNTAKRYRTTSWERARTATLRGRPDDFAKFLRKLARPTQVAFQRLMSAYNGEPIGIELKSKDRDAWAFIVANMSGNEAWRIVLFDLDGFFSHSCYNEFVEAVERMLQDGYVTVDGGALDRVAATARWAMGVRRAAVMQRHQERLTTYEEMLQEMKSLALAA